MAYRFDLPPSPEQLTAIGMVAVEWSYLESVLDAAIGTLAGMYEEDRLEAITTHLPFRARVEMLATLFDLSCKQDQTIGHLSESEVRQRRTTFATIRKRIETLSVKRNTVVHARWVTGSFGSPMTYVVQARGTLTRIRRGVPTKEILGIAERIAEQSRELRSLFDIELSSS